MPISERVRSSDIQTYQLTLGCSLCPAQFEGRSLWTKADIPGFNSTLAAALDQAKALFDAHNQQVHNSQAAWRTTGYWGLVGQ